MEDRSPAGRADLGGGACNTRLSPKTRTPDAGCDTWRLIFKTADPLPPKGKLGHYDVLPFASHSSFVLDGHPTPGKLSNGRELFEALDAACALAVDHVGPHTTFEGPSRVDSTANLGMESAAEGIALLSGCAALIDSLPGVKPEVIGKPAETVYWLSKRGRGAKLARGYEASAMHPELAAERWEVIRFEDQRKLRRGRRPVTQDLIDPAYYRSRWRERFEPLWKHSKGVKVVSGSELPRKAKDLIRSGAMTYRQAERAVGFAVLASVGEAPSRASTYERRALLRDHGLVLSDDFFEPVEVELADVLERALDSPAWGAYG